MDLLSFLEFLVREGILRYMGRQMGFQFGTPSRAYLGATLLPERLVEENLYDEDDIKYRTVIAASGTRYSPAQIRSGNMIGGTMRVELGNSDIALEFTSRDYDALLRYLRNNNTTNAQAVLLGWVNTALNLALIEFNEKQRWEAIVDAQTVRRGDNNYQELVEYPNPSGHRVVAGGSWSDPNYDPMLDLLAGYDLLTGKGLTPNRIIMPNSARALLMQNPKVRSRLGMTFIDAGGQVDRRPSRASLSALNAIFAQEELPPVETYDLQYFTQDGAAHYFLPRGTMVMACTTGRTEEIVTDPDANEVRIMQDTLGYVGVGRAAGQAEPGRAFDLAGRTKKPPAVEGEGWQESLPVIMDPEALFVIKNIS